MGFCRLSQDQIMILLLFVVTVIIITLAALPEDKG
jgi:hypothetical protein